MRRLTGTPKWVAAAVSRRRRRRRDARAAINRRGVTYDAAENDYNFINISARPSSTGARGGGGAAHYARRRPLAAARAFRGVLLQKICHYYAQIITINIRVLSKPDESNGF